MINKILVFIVLFIIVSIGGIWFWWQINSTPVNPSDTSQKVFVIEQGAGVRSIANDLKQQGLIKSPTAFYLWVKFNHLENGIQAGDFRLSPSMSLAILTKNLTHGSLDYWVTIPDGKRALEIAAILQEKTSNYSDAWKEELIQNEGYLFPDTYLIPSTASIDDIVALLRKNFDAKYATITANNALSEKQIVTVASLVEREARFPEDKPLVASVIYNRLHSGMPLQIDATVQYAVGYDKTEQSWWKKGLTVDDLKIDSPYNSYTNTGLPPTPICNPGASDLEAAANPANTDYIFYVSDSSGHLHFAKTLQQHNANIKKYQVQ